MKGMEKVGYTLYGKKKTKVLRKSRRVDGGRKSWREGLSENKGMLKKKRRRNTKKKLATRTHIETSF
jgi:hypothetical protein